MKNQSIIKRSLKLFAYGDWADFSSYWKHRDRFDSFKMCLTHIFKFLLLNIQVKPNHSSATLRVREKMGNYYHLIMLTVLTMFQPFWPRFFWNCLRTSATFVPWVKWTSSESFKNKEAWILTILQGWKKGTAIREIWRKNQIKNKSVTNVEIYWVNQGVELLLPPNICCVYTTR